MPTYSGILMQQRDARCQFLRRLRWGAIVVPALVILASESIRHGYFDDTFPVWLGNLLSAAVALLASYLFATVIFHFIERLDADLVAQNRRLAALNALSATTHEPGDEAALLGASLPVIRDALAVEQVVFSADGACQSATGAGGVAHPLVHDGTALGTLSLHGVGGSLDRALLASLGDMLAVALANRRLAAQIARIAMLEERDRIARELHDGLAQMLATIAFQGERARAVLADGNPHAARVALDRIEEASSMAYTDVREAIVGLRTDTDGDLREMLQQTADGFTDATNIAVMLECAAIPTLRNPLAELQLLRVVQESLTNVRKHARATRVEIRVTADTNDGRLVLSIRDDGIGFDPDQLPRIGRQHFGLLVMRERIESLGGRLAITSAPGSGATVTATIPLATEARGVA
jgi:signal transduction histidine kinase